MNERELEREFSRVLRAHFEVRQEQEDALWSRFAVRQADETAAWAAFAAALVLTNARLQTARRASMLLFNMGNTKGGAQ